MAKAKAKNRTTSPRPATLAEVADTARELAKAMAAYVEPNGNTRDRWAGPVVNRAWHLCQILPRCQERDAKDLDVLAPLSQICDYARRLLVWFEVDGFISQQVEVEDIVRCASQSERWGIAPPECRTWANELADAARDLGIHADMAEKPTEHVFGLLVYGQKRVVSREGFDKNVDLSSSPLGWHIFNVVLHAAPKQASLQAMQKDYPGEWDARGPAVNDLNKRLSLIGLKINNRTLQARDRL